MTLRDSEVGLIVALEVMGGQATTEEIAAFAGMNQDYVRNLIARLRSEGIIESVSAAVGFGFLGNRKDLAGREKINVLGRPFDQIFEENESEFLNWAKIVLKAPTKRELLNKISELRKERTKSKS
jgi:DNA-binding CsgD family transcriptional regulator